MTVVFGTHLLGKIDAVPGYFYVATKCAHFCMFPLFPMQTYVVLDGSYRPLQAGPGGGAQGFTGAGGQIGMEWTGVPIPLSGKSVLMAYLRPLCVLAMVIGGCIYGILMAGSRNNAKEAPVGLAIALPALAVLLFTYLYGGITRASRRRATELGQILGLDTKTMSQVISKVKP
jgi:hypothetical protein